MIACRIMEHALLPVGFLLLLLRAVENGLRRGNHGYYAQHLVQAVVVD